MPDRTIRPIAEQPRALRWLRLFWLRLRLRWVEDDIRYYQADNPAPNPLQLALWRACAQEYRVEIMLIENTL